MLYIVPENAILKDSSNKNAKITKVEFSGNIPIDFNRTSACSV